MAKVSRRRRKVGVDAGGRPVYRDEGWKVRYVDPDGAEKLRVFAKKADAARYATEVEHRKLSGLYVDPTAGRVTFREYAEAWRIAQPHRPSTAEQVESRLRLHAYPTIGDRPIASIRPTQLQALVKDRAQAMAPSTLENLVTWVATIFKAAVRDRIITTSPAEGLKLPAVGDPDPVVPFDLDAVDALAEALPARLQAMVALGVGAGLRSGEVLGLTLDRVNFLKKELRVDRQLLTPTGGPCELGPPKTKASRRTIPLPDVVIQALAAHVKAFPPVELELFDRVEREVVTRKFLFTNARGEAIRRARWGETWAAAVAKAGQAKGTRFHRLRHTYASLLIRAGCSVKVVQARLGHATAQETLDTYAHLWPDDEDRTRAAVDAVLGARPATLEVAR